MSSLDNVNVNVPSGCDNAPRKKVLIDVTLAFLTSDVDFC
ncbi:uncharacterized protein YcnI [Alkalihalobacillus xiaoxiensis]|uniref:Uncharacterized protein YcnI n=1 Tax=Shouchella xiaoxiensis TaxID=766895 RepID=A0ABS2SQM8_9BACI|nr:uncharacterized protein YcnI [Shouchella xiaoxiensis]